MAVIHKSEQALPEPETRTLSEHDALCELARKWLLRPHSARGPGCIVALREMSTIYGGECPDALGWRAGGPWSGSYLVEVKTSRSDFLGDKNKPFRQQPETGVGNWRFYLCPEALITIEDLPEGWGLLWANSRGHIKPIHFPHIDKALSWQDRKIKAAAYRFDCNRDQEMTLFLSALRSEEDPQGSLDQRRAARNMASRIQGSLDQERSRHHQTQTRLSEMHSKCLRLEAEIEIYRQENHSETSVEV